MSLEHLKSKQYLEILGYQYWSIFDLCNQVNHRSFCVLKGIKADQSKCFILNPVKLKAWT